MAQDSDKRDGQDGVDHQATYLRFMAITKWAVVGIAAALVALALFLA
ncbi:MAG: aa3-type cytochrome c oxidase subunit IV [Polymorphobacter sp.]